MEPEPGEDLTTLHVRRARTGDGDSLGWVIERFTPLLLAQARYRLGPALAARIDPEDLVQDVWATTLPRLADLGLRDGRTTPVLLRFLSTSLLNRVNTVLRRHARTASVGSGVSEVWSRLPDASRGPLSRAVVADSTRILLAAIEELSPRDREVLVLRGIEQRSTRETGEVLGVSAEAAGQAYLRALARVRAKLPRSVLDELE